MIFSVSGMLAACTTVPVTPPKPSDAELIRNLPQASRMKVLNLFLRDYRRPQDPEVDAYLTGIAERVASRGTTREKPSLRTLLISSPNRREKNFVWPIPPDSVLFEAPLLRSLEFENEIAAAIAYAWQLTQGPDFQDRFLTEVDRPQPDLQKIYQFSEAESLSAVETSIDLLYVSRYDPRGLVSYFEKLKKLNRGNKDVLHDRLTRLQERARRTLAAYPPLTNPTIRTQEFYRIRKRLEKL